MPTDINIPRQELLEEHAYLVQLLSESAHDPGALEHTRSVLDVFRADLRTSTIKVAELERENREGSKHDSKLTASASRFFHRVTGSISSENLHDAKNKDRDKDRDKHKDKREPESHMQRDRLLAVWTRKRILAIEVKNLEVKARILQRRTRHYEEVQHRLHALYDHIFDGTEPSSREEDGMEDDARRAQRTLFDVQKAFDSHRMLTALLFQADFALANAAQHLGASGNPAEVDAAKTCAVQASTVVEQAKWVDHAFFEQERGRDVLRAGWLADVFRTPPTGDINSQNPPSSPQSLQPHHTALLALLTTARKRAHEHDAALRRAVHRCLEANARRDAVKRQRMIKRVGVGDDAVEGLGLVPEGIGMNKMAIRDVTAGLDDVIPVVTQGQPSEERRRVWRDEHGEGGVGPGLEARVRAGLPAQPQAQPIAVLHAPSPSLPRTAASSGHSILDAGFDVRAPGPSQNPNLDTSSDPRAPLIVDRSPPGKPPSASPLRRQGGASPQAQYETPAQFHSRPQAQPTSQTQSQPHPQVRAQPPPPPQSQPSSHRVQPQSQSDILSVRDPAQLQPRAQTHATTSATTSPTQTPASRGPSPTFNSNASLAGDVHSSNDGFGGHAPRRSPQPQLQPMFTPPKLPSQSPSTLPSQSYVNLPSTTARAASPSASRLPPASNVAESPRNPSVESHTSRGSPREPVLRQSQTALNPQQQSQSHMPPVLESSHAPPTHALPSNAHVGTLSIPDMPRPIPNRAPTIRSQSMRPEVHGILKAPHAAPAPSRLSSSDDSDPWGVKAASASSSRPQPKIKTMFNLWRSADGSKSAKDKSDQGVSTELPPKRLDSGAVMRKLRFVETVQLIPRPEVDSDPYEDEEEEEGLPPSPRRGSMIWRSAEEEGRGDIEADTVGHALNTPHGRPQVGEEQQAGQDRGAGAFHPAGGFLASPMSISSSSLYFSESPYLREQPVLRPNPSTSTPSSSRRSPFSAAVVQSYPTTLDDGLTLSAVKERSDIVPELDPLRFPRMQFSIDATHLSANRDAAGDNSAGEPKRWDAVDPGKGFAVAQPSLGGNAYPQRSGAPRISPAGGSYDDSHVENMRPTAGQEVDGRGRFRSPSAPDLSQPGVSATSFNPATSPPTTFPPQRDPVSMGRGGPTLTTDPELVHKIFHSPSTVSDRDNLFTN